MEARNINWETDGFVIEWLPSNVVIPTHIEEDEIANYLSDEYGFLVESFEFEH